ncbi:MAG TPA: response regulator transcription factor [Anaerolineales bacterium]|jgi:two-component system KDP operon response regulator KdpE|nr:response regulator transcription factor [Anaerolineales bacterium]
MPRTTIESEELALQSPGLDLDAVQAMGDQRVVLVVEDDIDTLNLLKLTLRRAGMNVVGAMDGKQAIRKWMESNPNIVLLDIMMPEMDGWETLSQLRAITDAPIIILSALTQKDNVVRGLRQGADDYVGKPFAGDEVIARVEAALRRSGPKTPVSKIAFPENGLSMDLETHQASYRGNTIDLTPREFSVLEILAKHHPKPVSYETLATEVWGQDNEKIRERIKWIVYLLRQKIEKDPSNPKLILNKTRYGYHLAVE